MNIRPDVKNLEELLSGLYTKYSVPPYQRDYSWREDQLNELWTDLIHSWENDRRHFLGTVVLNAEGGDERKYDIVDGQQRLASLSILFACIRDRCIHFEEKYDDLIYDKVTNLDRERNLEAAGHTSDMVRPRICNFGASVNFYLQLNEKDQPIFKAKIQEQGDALNTKDELKVIPNESRLLKAKKFFSSKLIERFLTISDSFVELHSFSAHLLTKIPFLRLAVESDSDAYLLFESLNDRGLDLSIADLVKNRILLECGEDEEKKERVLEAWDGIVKSLGSSSFPAAHDFLRFYWLAFEGPTTRKELYRRIKDHLSEPNIEVESFVNELADVANDFVEITANKFPSTEYSRNSKEQYLAEINTLGYSVCYPLFLRAMRDKPEYMEALAKRTIAFLFRLISVANFSAGQAEEAFNRALAKLKAGKSEDEIIQELNHQEIGDEVFSERVRTGRFETNRIARYLLCKIHTEGLSPAQSLTSEAHLEHVLPIKHDRWEFDTKGRNIDEWKYCIGNMTLLEESLNARNSNKPFINKVSFYEKKEGVNGHTSIPMAYEIHEAYKQDGRTWDADWIQERADAFAEAAPGIWELPQYNTVDSTQEAETSETGEAGSEPLL